MLKLKKCHFSSLQNILNCQAEYPLKTDISHSVSKSSMSASSNSIAQFLSFGLKIGYIKFNLTGLCDKGSGLVSVTAGKDRRIDRGIGD